MSHLRTKMERTLHKEDQHLGRVAINSIWYSALPFTTQCASHKSTIMGKAVIPASNDAGWRGGLEWLSLCQTVNPFFLWNEIDGQFIRVQFWAQVRSNLCAVSIFGESFLCLRTRSFWWWGFWQKMYLLVLFTKYISSAKLVRWCNFWNIGK